MKKNRQDQKIGNNSTSLQAGGDIHLTQGLSYIDAREIALDVFKSNFYQLAGEAVDIANKRAEEFTEKLIEKLQLEGESLLNSMKDPDMQYALYTAQKEYARSGDENLSEMLVEILVDRAGIEERSLMQIVLNESLEVLPKLTQSQLNILSLVFIIKYTRRLTIKNLNGFKEYLINTVYPFLQGISDSASTANYQHLEYSGCGSISVLEHKIEDEFKVTYPGIFMKGFKRENFEQVVGNEVLEENIIIPSLHNHELFQISALNDDVLEDVCKSAGGSDELCARVKELQNSNTLSSKEIKEYLISLDPKIKKILEVWERTTLKMMTLTSVGIALAHANIKRKINEEFDLPIWIS